MEAAEKTAENLITDPAGTGKLACESCGAEFTCNAGEETCWCFEVKLSSETLAEVSKNFQKCLCKECLEQIQADKQ
jgi:hypothetical protein